MPDLNIRNVDVTLVTSLKQRALASGQTLRSYCIGKLGESDDRDIERNDIGRVDDSNTGGKNGGGRKRTTVPVLPKAKGKTKHVHPMQPLRNELVQGAGHLQSSSHEGHKTFIAGDGHWCSDCKESY